MRWSPWSLEGKLAGLWMVGAKYHQLTLFPIWDFSRPDHLPPPVCQYCHSLPPSLPATLDSLYSAMKSLTLHSWFGPVISSSDVRTGSSEDDRAGWKCFSLAGQSAVGRKSRTATTELGTSLQLSCRGLQCTVPVLHDPWAWLSAVIRCYTHKYTQNTSELTDYKKHYLVNFYLC